MSTTIPSAADIAAASIIYENPNNPASALQQFKDLKSFLIDSIAKQKSYVNYLPSIFQVKGSPYTLDDHFPYEPFFSSEQPASSITLAGRQVGKTQQSAAQITLECIVNPNYRVLVVTPLSDQARRISSDYIKPLIEQSPLRKYWADSKAIQGVWRKTFKNYSTMYFSFALTTVDRVRGISADSVLIDECQDVDIAHLPVILETMSHSKLALKRYRGTPKTMENTAEALWGMSSQAEWFIPCLACGFDSIPNTKFHLNKIIGPYRDDISDQNPATICAKCQKPINPRLGFWVHRYPERASLFPGYHVPQPIMPIHYSDKTKWSELLAKREGQWGYSYQKVMNEVYGESAGTGVQLVSKEELEVAADLPWANDPKDPNNAVKEINRYVKRVLAVDWGGGGEDETSLTVLVAMGILGNGKVEVMWATRSLIPHDHLGEADLTLELCKKFKCHYIAHDFTGAGSLRETFLFHKGFPRNRIIPISYNTLAGEALISASKVSDKRPRQFFIVDKPKSLLLTCAAIKLKFIRFFKYDYIDINNRGLIHDFLSLQENRIESTRGSGIYTIIRKPQLSDDFAQAVNIGAISLWQTENKFPDLNNYSVLKQKLSQIVTHIEDEDLNPTYDLYPDMG